jgi:hypothetical protein
MDHGTQFLAQNMKEKHFHFRELQEKEVKVAALV